MITEEEHHTRAMLLGLRYRPERGWYTSDGVKGKDKHPIHRVDAVTLEVITTEEHAKRVEEGSPYD